MSDVVGQIIRVLADDGKQTSKRESETVTTTTPPPAPPPAPPATTPYRFHLPMGLPTIIGVALVLIVGGVLTVAGTLTWPQYQHDAAILLAGLGIAHGIDPHSRP